MTWKQPPRTRTPSGALRRVGVEIEFAGLDVMGAARAVHTAYGGRVVEVSRFIVDVLETRLGDFHVEMDAKFLTDRRYLDWLRTVGIVLDADETDAVEDILEAVAAPFVPCEVVTPPVPLDRLPELNELRQVLRARRAQGTSASWKNAFGLHLNPELADYSAPSLLAHLRAFLASFEDLRAEMEVDLTRRIAPWVDPFPKAYARHIFQDEYRPSLTQLIEDYIDYNPTRNRPLDMLPAFAYLRPKVVAHRIDDELVKPRPTFHYRLPNSEIDDPSWSIEREWNRWVGVEELAERIMTHWPDLEGDRP